MKIYPAIALLELSNIAAGLKTADAMVKKSPIALLKTGTVSRGKYLILVGGTVAAVEEAYQEGLQIAGNARIDDLLLPDVHPDVYAASLGEIAAAEAEALGTLETISLATTIEAADAAIKGAAVQILSMGMGDGYGGKGYVLFNGRVEDVQMAIEIACRVANRKQCEAWSSVIPLLHEGVQQQLSGSARFRDSQQIHFSDGEQDVTG